MSSRHSVRPITRFAALPLSPSQVNQETLPDLRRVFNDSSHSSEVARKVPYRESKSALGLSPETLACRKTSLPMENSKSPSP